MQVHNLNKKYEMFQAITTYIAWVFFLYFLPFPVLFYNANLGIISHSVVCRELYLLQISYVYNIYTTISGFIPDKNQFVSTCSMQEKYTQIMINLDSTFCPREIFTLASRVFHIKYNSTIPCK